MYESLYLTAILPPLSLSERIQELKKEISEEFGTLVAVTKPAHITVLPPFKADTNVLEGIAGLCHEVCSDFTPFKLFVNGVGAFERNRVVFLKVENEHMADLLYQRLKTLILAKGLLHYMNMPFRKLTPHLTLAYRDLTPEMFQSIWKKYRGLDFKEEFEVNHLQIMKYVNGKWADFLIFPLSVKVST